MLVRIDGDDVNPYVLEGTEVTTIEGLASPERLHPLQEAFVKHDAVQCGFCIPGQIMTAYALLKRNPNPNSNKPRNQG